MEIIKCSECGSQITDDAQACPNCGCPSQYFQYEYITKTYKCAECGNMVDSEDEYCHNCGCPIDIIAKSDIRNDELTIEEKKALLKAKREGRSGNHAPLMDEDVEKTEQDKIDRLKSSEIDLGEELDVEQDIPQATQSIITKVVGVSFDNRQLIIRRLIDKRLLYIGAKLQIQQDRNNKYDRFAVQVLASDNSQIGYLSKDINRTFYEGLQSGKRYDVQVINIAGGNSYNYGITIHIKEE